MKRAKNKSIKSGFFLTLEGIDGVGKSTLFKKLNDYFIDQGYSPVLSREPGGTLLGEKLRRLLAQTPMQPWSEVFLLEASRTENTIENILPALNQKKLVICDRFTDSTIAYQVYGKKVNPRFIANIQKFILKGLSPNITFILKVSPKAARIRLKKRRIKNRYDNFSQSFYTKAQNSFLKIAKNKKNYFILDSSSNDGVLEKKIFNIVKKYLNI